MTLGRFNPLGETLSLRQAMDRLFEDSIVNPRNWPGSETQVSPALDVHETADAVVVTVSLPGIKPEDVDVTMQGQTLTIRGEFKGDESVERDQYLYQERRYGTFARQIQLPLRVQADKAEASFENGLLKLTIPKAEEVKPRQIQIKTAARNVSAETTSGGGDQG
ncbi:MAG: Hsp20/alpha crystallin family protein [Candidatus Limnocylindria bacterium]